jgi:hypothetical protein
MLCLSACGQETRTVTADRPTQLTNCRAISTDGSALTSCLILKYDWNADSATPAGQRFQRTIDSLLAIQEAKAESLRLEQAAQYNRANDRRVGPWVACVARIETPSRIDYTLCKSLTPSTGDFLNYTTRHRLSTALHNALDFALAQANAGQ